jgi:hypothetical protein
VVCPAVDIEERAESTRGLALSKRVVAPTDGATIIAKNKRVTHARSNVDRIDGGARRRTLTCHIAAPRNDVA